MEKGSFDLDGVTFIAGTLWTDMNKEDPSTLYGIKGYMNDYRIIEDSSEVVNYKTFEVENFFAHLWFLFLLIIYHN